MVTSMTDAQAYRWRRRVLRFSVFFIAGVLAAAIPAWILDWTGPRALALYAGAVSLPVFHRIATALTPKEQS